jgi:hypothetical protein
MKFRRSSEKGDARKRSPDLFVICLSIIDWG